MKDLIPPTVLDPTKYVWQVDGYTYQLYFNLDGTAVDSRAYFKTIDPYVCLWCRTDNNLNSWNNEPLGEANTVGERMKLCEMYVACGADTAEVKAWFKDHEALDYFKEQSND